ncbi:DUF445 domain-containing protein [Paenibacillus thalictri]|uniref:DUF445 domain-containing protein n=1 Tax=Paenibacillus thalictri TaxID=2527873 RepID=A0A4Q9DR42_9BACL|nr:DUF445 domain-containing protein [Paenibacillus thalictri]TBL76631.1 DUF445 domain-containing protein [Paenibacillus thalictri]
MEKKTRYVAGVSLGVMAAGFAVTLPFGGSGAALYLQGAFEAGLVGGLADWFAVTALFRHPLGIPIPHTSLLVKNRDKLTKALVTAVETELLNAGSIAEKLKSVNISERLLQWSERQLDTEEAGRMATAVCSYIVEHLPYEQIIALLKKEAHELADSIDFAALFVRAKDEVLNREWDKMLLDYLLEKADGWIVRTETRDMLGALALKALGNIQLGGFMGFAMGAFSGFMTEDKLGGIIQSLLLTSTHDLRRDSSSGRKSIIAEIHRLLEEAPDNPKFAEGVQSLKHMLADYAENSGTIDKLVMKLKLRAADFVQQPDFAPAYALPFLKRLVGSFRSNAAAVEQTEQWIQTKLLQVIADNHNKIGGLVKENVDKLDNRTLISMLEDKVGKDLQWIRVNGALCGFIIGLLLTVIKSAVS